MGYVRLNSAERAAVRQVADTVRRRFGATQVRLFGSAVQGTMDGESDIDLFIVLPRIESDSLERITDICTTAGQVCNRVISFVLYGADEVSHGPMAVSPLVRRVEREGVPV